jgi:hypothetical protein
MGAEFPRSPKILKGALVVFETTTPVPTNIIAFQYNPETMTRSLEQQSWYLDRCRSAGDTSRVLPPIETFQVSIELDAADQLESSNPLAMTTGLHPTLAAVELLLYPPSKALILNKALSLAGLSIISPAEAPLVMFVWGPARVVPVRVTSVSITEQAFDQRLNPIQARVELGLRTLTDDELAQPAGAPFETLNVVRLIAKEALARSAVFTGSEQVRGLLPF